MDKRNKPLLTISIEKNLLEKIIEISKKENINRSIFCEKLLNFAINKYEVDGINLLNNRNTKGLKQRIDNLEERVKELEAIMKIEMKSKKYENRFFYRKGFGQDLAKYITKALENTENIMPYRKVLMWLGKYITLKDIKTFSELSEKIVEVFKVRINEEEIKMIYKEEEDI